MSDTTAPKYPAPRYVLVSAPAGDPAIGQVLLVAPGPLSDLYEVPHGFAVDSVLIASDAAQVGWSYDPATGAFSAPPVSPPTVEDLLAYAKRLRDGTEAGGITVNGVAVQSDVASQNRVSTAYSGMLVSGAASIPFKADSGFITLTVDQLKAIGSALFAHTQACFAAEDAVDAGINASPPTITTHAQVAAAFAAVQSAY